MPLFRFHRGGLAESLTTTIIVKDFNELVKEIILSGEAFNLNTAERPKVSIEPYPDKDNNFDKRIGWFTQIVCTNLYSEDEMQVIGFLSEPF